MHTVTWAVSFFFVALCGAASAAEITTEPSATEVVAGKSGAMQSLPTESATEEKETAEGKPKFIALSAEDAAALKNIKVLVSLEQKKPVQQTVSSPVILVLPDPTGAVNWGAVLVAGLISGGLHSHYHDIADDILPEEQQKTRTAPHFRKIKLKDGVFIQSVNRAVASPFEGENWFDNVEISMMPGKVTKTVFRTQLQKLQKERNLPDAVAIITNQFILGLDLCKLWFTTDIKIYRVMRKKYKGNIPIRLVHQERFMSLYNLREHFEIVEPEDDWEKEEYIAEYWTRDNGKLYYDTVTQLASENAKMVKRFLLDQPPHTLMKTKENAAIMALYEIEPEVEEPEKSEKEMSPKKKLRAAKKLEKRKQKERLADGKAMEEMDPVLRKAYMLGKEHEYVSLVEIIETAIDRTIVRNQNTGFYFSLPNKNMKLVMQSAIDPDEYSRIVSDYQEQKQKKKHKRMRKSKTKEGKAKKLAAEGHPPAEPEKNQPGDNQNAEENKGDESEGI